MMNLRATAANLVWMGSSARAWSRYRAALENPARAQYQKLAGLLRSNAATDFGHDHAFSRIPTALRCHSAAAQLEDLHGEYRARVPLTSYDQLEPFINRIARGKQRVLTCAPVSRLVPSSGSTAAAKLLPYTAALQGEFSHAVGAWIFDLLAHTPTLSMGPAYWSITPSAAFERIACKSQQRVGSTPGIGFDDDSEYLGGRGAAVTRALTAVPNMIRHVVDPEAFRYVTLLFLLRVSELRLISIWHPSYLERLLDAVPLYFDRLVRDIERGTLTPPGEIPSAVRSALVGQLAASPRRAARLRRVVGRDNARGFWPRLARVSCWAHGAAAVQARHLASRIPGVELQPKGLIATEGIVTIPFGANHPIAIESHFFEFIDQQERPRLANALELGAEYRVVLTTGGGLYRYELGDRVRVDAMVGATPSLTFIGRADGVSDRVGEKLSEAFVASALQRVFVDRQAPRFAMLAPEQTACGLRYILYVDSDAPPSEGVAAALERELRWNPQYAWCVDLGQLRPARVVHVPPGADRIYVDMCVARGQRLGDVKPVALHRDVGWARLFEADASRA